MNRGFRQSLTKWEKSWLEKNSIDNMQCLGQLTLTFSNTGSSPEIIHKGLDRSTHGISQESMTEEDYLGHWQ